MLPLEQITVGGLLRRTAALFPNRPALIWHDIPHTYAELDALTDRYAATLIRLGVEKGDHIALYGETETDVVSLFYAITRVGAVAVMINTSLASEDLERVLRLSDPKFLLIGRSYNPSVHLKQNAASIGALPTLNACYAVGEDRSDLSFPLLEPGMADGGLVCAREAEVLPSDTAAIIFTSGSTGAPKPVMTSHFSRANSGIQQAHDLAADCRDVFCVTMPMYHCFCISANVLAAAAVGACLCLPDDRHTGSVLRAVQEHRATLMHAVPSMFRAMMARPDFDSWDLSSLRAGLIGGSGYPPKDFVTIEKRFGMLLLASLGQTEATAGLSVSALTDSLEVRSTTVGHFMDHVEGKLVSLETGETAAPGEIGEICVRGYLVMQGVYRQPEQTAKTIDADGWLHTGDLATLDADGNLKMCGRCKDLIIRGGENISPIEIQDHICSLPQVPYCKIVPVPDAHYGEEACACVQVAEGQSITADEIRAFLKGRIADYKIPRYILFFKEFPTNTTGKVDPRATAAIAREILGL